VPDQSRALAPSETIKDLGSGDMRVAPEKDGRAAPDVG
jgi:hypothetical protein